MQTDAGYVPVGWVVRYAAATPSVRDLRKNRQGETLSLSAAARGPALRPAVGLGPDDPAR